jgi:hypothetical protein
VRSLPPLHGGFERGFQLAGVPVPEVGLLGKRGLENIVEGSGHVRTVGRQGWDRHLQVLTHQPLRGRGVMAGCGRGT